MSFCTNINELWNSFKMIEVTHENGRKLKQPKILFDDSYLTNWCKEFSEINNTSLDEARYFILLLSMFDKDMEKRLGDCIKWKIVR